MLKFIWKDKYSRIAQKILVVLRKAREQILPDTKCIMKLQSSKFGACERKAWQIHRREESEKIPNKHMWEF